MKKILMAVFAILMTAAWVAPAMADTTFYGTYRVRMFNTNNASDFSDDQKLVTYTGVGSATATGAGGTTDNNSWVDQRFRLSVESKASDNLRGFVQLQIGNTGGPNRSTIWGDGSYTSNTVFARQAYLSFNAGPVRVKAGRQIFGDAPDGGQSFRVADDNVYYGLMDGGLVLVSQIDAFILTTKAVDPLTFYFGYAKLAEGSTGSGSRTIATTKDDDLYILQATIAPSDAMKAGAYFLYESDHNETTGGARTPWWLGAGLDAKFDPIKLKVHAAYMGGKHDKGCVAPACGLTTGSDDLKYSAYAIDGDLSMNLGQATVGVAAGMGSGDKSTQDTKSKTFTGVAGSYGNQLGARPAIFFDSGEVSNGGASLNRTNANGITSDGSNIGNVTFAQLYGSFKATDDLTLSGLIAGFWHTEKESKTLATNTDTWESKLGNELDLTAVYKLYPQLALVAQAGWFMPDAGIRTYKHTSGSNKAGSIATDDTVSEYFAKIQYDF